MRGAMSLARACLLKPALHRSPGAIAICGATPYRGHGYRMERRQLLPRIQPMEQSKRRRDRGSCVTHATNAYAKRAMNNSFARRGINGNRKLKMKTQIYSSISSGRFAPNPEQIREAAADLYHACKFVLDPSRSGYSLFSNRATIILEAAVAKAEGRSHGARTT